MSKYSDADTIEERGIRILYNALDPEFFLPSDFAKIVGKDKYPDIDGQIRLRDGFGTYLNCYLHYQTKSHRSIKNLKKYPLKRKDIDYLIDTSVPTLFFVVENETKRCFWYFLDETEKRKLHLTTDNKGRNIDLSNSEIKNDYPTLLKTWEKISRKDDYDEISLKLDNAISKFELNLRALLGILYLFKIVKKEDLPKYFSDILNINNHESLTIIKYLEEGDVISSTPNVYLLENEKLGVECLFDLLNSNYLDFENLDKATDINSKKTIFQQLNKIEHPSVTKYFQSTANQFKSKLSRYKNNDEIYYQLELLREYKNRVPNKSIQIAKAIVDNKNLLKTISSKIDGWEFPGKSNDDLIIITLEILSDLRYIKIQDVFKILIKLSDSENEQIAKKALEVLTKIAKYDYYALNNIGYYPQIELLDFIEKFTDRKLKKHFKSVLEILDKIVGLDFESSSWSDYQTIQFQRGALKASKNLENIRLRAFTLLKKINGLTNTLDKQKKVLQTLESAATLPYYGQYNEKLITLVVKMANNIIKYYIELVPTYENELIKVIDHQLHRFSRKFPNKLKNNKKLESLITQNDIYGMFKTFVGYDHEFSGSEDWKDIRNKRTEKIEGFVKDINKSSFLDWENKILSVLKNYGKTEDRGQYQYFNIFLNKLGKEKPQLAKKLIKKNEHVLENFLTHIVAGIWQSKSQDISKKMLSEWIKEGKYLSTCAYIFTYVNEIDYKIIQDIFNAAKKYKDVAALNNIIRALNENFDNTKVNTQLFIKTIKELTKNNNSNWVYVIWSRENSVMEKLTSIEIDVVLNNLLLLPNIKYEAEEILIPITKSFPKKIIKFLKDRVAIQDKISKSENYEAIPYEFGKLTEQLLHNEKLIIEEVMKWYKSKSWRWRWEAGKFLKSVFPINSYLDEKLVNLLNTGNQSDVDTVLSILNTYQGRISLDDTFVKTLIRKFPKYHGDAMSSMSMAGGVVSGEYGIAESYESKRNNLKKWKNDSRKYMRNFIQKYDKYLKQQIDYERKRVDESIKLMKHKYK